MFPLGLSVVSGVVHWMIVRLGLTLHHVPVKPRLAMEEDEMHQVLCLDPENAKKTVSAYILE